LIYRQLGKPAFVFQPWEFGDPYEKKTALWGNFKEPKKHPCGPLIPIQKTDHGHNMKMHDLPSGYKFKEGRNDRRSARRAVTPSGLAQMFFEANH
jgi:hypothetical protein